MAVVYSSDFDTTPPADETVATSGTHTSGGSGNGMAAVQIGSNGANIVWDSASPHTGTRCMRVDVGNPTSFTVMAPFSGTTKNVIYTRFYVKFSTVGEANSVFAGTTGGVGQLQLRTDGVISVRNNSSSIGMTTTSLSANTWYGIEWKIDSVNDVQELKLYDGTYSDVIETVSGAYTQAAPSRLNLGNITGNPNGWAIWYDDIIVDDGIPRPAGKPRRS